GGLDPVLGHEDLVQQQRLGAAAAHADGVPVVADGVVLARHHGEAVGLFAGRVEAVEADDGPFGVVAAAAPAHFAAEQHAAVDFLGAPEGGDAAAGGGVGVLGPELVLQLLGEH